MNPAVRSWDWNAEARLQHNPWSGNKKQRRKKSYCLRKRFKEFFVSPILDDNAKGLSNVKKILLALLIFLNP